ncbi:hypothetical protein P168DRAFT_312776 [Aspergillus campestris IBT 28561]|uniref:PH domain-containing protein n=1 Tax=Aspergillus campestris (strain IBT 28561) TaxID=1392248 RepID=A0A2I1CVP8_ASPC2|nr:uncharacterized protein P168DRAFT_312776 [Aspergillus campestris IBT 28561]PKY01685.1 hypothetical protein P168DRAFT_312776 [Aspergillus campestris IBT 28561]
MSLNIPPPRPSVSERRGQQLAPLQTNFSRPNGPPLVLPSRPQRPRPEEYQVYGETDRVPLNAPAKRQSSKSSLRTIFTRDKQPRRPHDKPLSGIDEAQNPTPQAAAAAAAPYPLPRRLPPPNGQSQTHRWSHPRREVNEDGAPAGDVIWKPPPLFQAYPQALKHDILPAPVLSADSILRIHATSMAKYRDEAAHSHRDDSAGEIAARKKKEDKERSKHLRSLSGTISKAEWTKKIFVLGTTGYIMQYSGSGKHDRLPEKVLQLGPASVAFASDAIPGKHWVLQISHTAEATDPTTEAPRPRFSRFGFHRSHTRRLAHSFLLVFTSPEDMSSWLLAVRAQIEARGGKKYVSEKVFDEDMEHELHPKSSVRQPAKRDPNRFSQVYLQPQQSAALDDRESQSDAQSRQGSNISLHRRSFIRQHTSDSRSDSVSTTHTDVTSPLNNGSGRFYGPTTDSNSNSPGTTSSASVLANYPATRSISPPPLNAPAESSMRVSVKPPVHHPATRPTSPPHAPLNMPVQPSMHIPRNPPVHPSAHPATRPTSPPMHAPLNMPVPPSIPRSFSPPPNAALNMPSPGLSIHSGMSNSGLSNIHEPQWTFQDNPKRRSLRMASSEDALSETLRHHGSSTHRLSRMAPSSIMTSTPSPRFPTFAEEDPESPYDDLPTPQLPPANGDPYYYDPPRPRPPASHQADPSRLSMGPVARRKSMPGLSVGPPAAPPPNCPLPKIPSPLQASHAHFPSPPRHEHIPTSPPRDPRSRRRSIARPAHPTRAPAPDMRVASAGHARFERT